MTKPMANKEPIRSKWDIEDAHRTLQRAADIQSDKSMMKDIVSHHNKLTQVLAKGGAVKATPAKSTPSKPSSKKK